MTWPNQQFLLLLPDAYSGAAVPLIIYHHGSGGTCSQTRSFDMNDQAIAYLLLNGYAVASSNSHGTHWGNDTGQADYIELYNFVRTQIPVSRVVALSGSMGGLPGLLINAARTIPYRGWAGAAPVCNLANMYAGVLKSEIEEAYNISPDGSNYASRTAGHDPVLLDGSLYAGLRMRFYASPSDDLVAKSANSDVMAAVVDGYAVENDVYVASGGHNDPSHYPLADMLSFFNRCV